MKQLIILRGLPGSGKTTFANFLCHNNPEAVAVSADDYFYDKDGNYDWNASKIRQAHEWCQAQVKMHMQNSAGTIVVHNTSTTEKELKPYLDLATENGYNVVSLLCENRHGGSNVHSVPQETLDKMKGRFHVKLI